MMMSKQWVWVVVPLLLSGCHVRQWMYDTGRLKPYEPVDFFKDGSSSRTLVDHTIPRGHLEDDELLFTGKQEGKLSNVFPFKVTKEDLLKGKEQYEIFCAVCHGPSGYGNGMIVQRGFKKPVPFHDKRLQDSPAGYFFDVISNGFGVMNAYRGMIPVEERWRIVAYLRALQRSQNASMNEVPEEERANLDQSSEHAEEAS